MEGATRRREGMESAPGDRTPSLTLHPKRKLLSIVVPVMNEEGNIVPLYHSVQRVMESLRGAYDWELLFTDNHSTDTSFQLLTDLAQRDPRVRVIRFSRNFGYQRSILTGYLNAIGDAAVQLDCDMEDPPELIPEMVDCWERGSHVVYGVRRKRCEGRLLTFLRQCYYRGLNRISDHPLPVDAGDFRLIDRRIIEELRKVDDASPYLRGLIATFGFKQTGLVYDRAPRTAGSSKFRLRHLVSLAIDGVLTHSFAPLRLATYTSFFVVILALALLLAYTSLRFSGLGDSWPPGFATTVILILLSMGMNAFFLGILGEYLGRVFRQVRHRPVSIIEHHLNRPANPDPAVYPQQ